MADRTAAGLFARIYEYLARQDTDAARTFAHDLWDDMGEYDFAPHELGCDDALIELGLGEWGVRPGYPEDGEVMLYGPEGDRR